MVSKSRGREPDRIRALLGLELVSLQKYRNPHLDRKSIFDGRSRMLNEVKSRLQRAELF